MQLCTHYGNLAILVASIGTLAARPRITTFCAANVEMQSAVGNDSRSVPESQGRRGGGHMKHTDNIE